MSAGETNGVEIDPGVPRSVLHFFEAHDRATAQRLTDLLNAKYEPSGGHASFTGVDVDLTDPEAAPYHVAFEHEAVVNGDYLATVREIEALAGSAGAEYGGWQAEEE